MKDIDFTYSTIGNSKYLMMDMGNGEKIINYQMQMLLNNKIQGLLDIGKTQQNDNVQICHDISSRVTLEDIISKRRLTKSEFVNLISCILNVYEEIKEYQLVNTGILLDTKMIYMKQDDTKYEFVYVPCYLENCGTEKIKEFLLDIVLHSKIESTNDNFIQICLDKLNSNNLTIDSVRSIIKYKEYSKYSEIPKQKPDIADFQGKRHPIFGDDIVENDKEEEEQNKQLVKSNPWTTKFILLQAVIIVLFAVLFASGIFTGENGEIHLDYIGAAVIAAAAMDFIIYREMKKKIKPYSDETENGKKKEVTVKRKYDMPGKISDMQKPSEKPEKEVRKVPEKPLKGIHKPSDIQKKFNNPIHLNKDIREIPPKPQRPQAKAAANPVKDKKTGFDTAKDNNMRIQNNTDNRQYAVSDRAADIYDEFGNEDTVYLVSAATNDDNISYLEYVENGLPLKIYLTKPNFIIGKQKSNVDYPIVNNKVSKIHAEVILKNGRYYIKDCNSMNGTYINGGSRILSNAEFEIHDGDNIRLANVDMVFHI